MDVDEQAAAADRALGELQKAIQAAPKKLEEKKEQVASCEKLAQRVRQSVDSYRIEVNALSKEEQIRHKQRLKELENGLKQCRSQIEWKKLESQPIKSSGFDAPPQPEEDGPISVQQAAAMAESTQKSSMESVARSKKMVLEAEQIGIATLDKMYAQEEQMGRIGEDVEDVKANIQRSKKLIGHIARQAASDRCIQLFCMLVTVAIIIMVALGITGKDGGQLNVPEQVRQDGTRRLREAWKYLRGVSGDPARA
eukprot:TRINITY_DN39667_c0_g1_i1.p1 TRINITY_DN39667_c0_g1~~TRINITY_DN39667_c0_g1_i1.p1  ORF type:complete len:253 (-),score=91.50 TRINITY_DN39667_c0_g1_i1:78-836(-)